MSRRFRLQLERVNLLAVLVVVGALVLAVAGRMDPKDALLIAASIAVPAQHADSGSAGS